MCPAWRGGMEGPLWGGPMTGAGMRRYITYRAMITVDQQHTCQAAQWWDAARSFVQSATAASVGSGVRRDDAL